MAGIAATRLTGRARHGSAIRDVAQMRRERSRADCLTKIIATASREGMQVRAVSLRPSRLFGTGRGC
jgi:hypothetical protein